MLTKRTRFGAYNWFPCLTSGGWLGGFNSRGQNESMSPCKIGQDKPVCSYNQSQVFKPRAW